MKRFAKVALLLAAMALAVSGAAFAYPLEGLPGDLANAVDVHLVSDDTGTKDFNFLVSQDKTAALESLEFVISPDLAALAGPSLVISNSFGVFSGDIGDAFDSAFSKLLVRTTDKTFSMSFEVASLDGAMNTPVTFGLWSGYERTVTPGTPGADLAADCTIECDYFFHEAQHTDPLTGANFATSKRTLDDVVTWTGTGEHEFFVECCDHLGIVASHDSALQASTLGSLDMVVAHLSPEPFVRVQVVDAWRVLGINLPYNETYHDSDVVSTDYREWRGSEVFNVVPVDVPEGETYNLGVHYTVSGDCAYCGTIHCIDKNGMLPFVSVTNLGTEGVFIGENYEKNGEIDVADWLCNSWCGLCEFNDMMSGDQGSLLPFSLAGASGTETHIKSQSALWDCVCHIYPAFTNSFKVAGNVDIDWKGYKTVDGDKADVYTTIAGRINTSWVGKNFQSSSLCDSCDDDAWLFEPCTCLPIIYRNALGLDSLLFATEAKLDSASVNALEEVDYAGVAGEFVLKDDVSADILLTKVSLTLSGGDLQDAGLVEAEDWWRTDLWNKLTFKINGIALDAANVESVGTEALDADELSFLTIVNGPRTQQLAESDQVDVDLFLFIYDGGDEPAVKYYKASNGNRFLVYFDGEADGKFTYSATIEKGAAPDPGDEFAVDPEEVNLYLDSTTTATLEAVNATGTVTWEIASGDEEFVTVSPDQGTEVTVTALKVTVPSVTITAVDESGVSADSVVWVYATKPVSPDVGGSGGGCSMGFAPAALLLLAPLGFLRRK